MYTSPIIWTNPPSMVPILKSYDKFLTTKSISFIVNPIEVTKWEDQHGHLQVQAHEILVRFQEARSICTSEITEGATEIKRSTLFVMFTWDYNSIYTWAPNWHNKKISQFSCSSELVPFSG